MKARFVYRIICELDAMLIAHQLFVQIDGCVGQDQFVVLYSVHSSEQNTGFLWIF